MSPHASGVGWWPYGPSARGARYVRRLATQSRDDVYSSLRDYQELHLAQGVAFDPAGTGQHCLTFVARPNTSANSDYIGAAAYLCPSEPVSLEFAVKADGEAATVTAQLGGQRWNRVGV